MLSVESSLIEAIGYDLSTRELYVRFRETGNTYVYDGVEQSIFEEFKVADSKGKFFNKRVRDKYADRLVLRAS